MKRFFAVFCVLFVTCFFVTGCGEDGKPFLLEGIGRNFYKSEFDENYTYYEDELKAAKSAKTITITGSVTSGIIVIELIEKDKDGNAKQTFEFTITDTLNETIELDKKHSVDWLVISRFNENTEGGFNADVFG